MANELFSDLKQKHPFVAADEFGGVLRNIYGSSTRILSTVPDVAVSNTLS
jgi:hypothetical protein